MKTERILLFVKSLVLVSMIGFSSCMEEFSLFGANEEIPVIFAFLNYHDSVNYIRISRTIQPDKGFTRRIFNFYNPDSVAVALEVWNLGARIGNPVRYIRSAMNGGRGSDPCSRKTACLVLKPAYGAGGSMNGLFTG